MSRKIIYDTQAQQQIGEIYRYGKERFGPQTAARFKETLRQTIALLKQHPLMGSVEPELSTDCHEYRYLLVNPYKVICHGRNRKDTPPMAHRPRPSDDGQTDGRRQPER